MQEFMTPGAVDVAAGDNVITALLDNGERSPERAALSYRAADRFVDVSTAQLVTTVRSWRPGSSASASSRAPGSACSCRRDRVHLPRLRHLGRGLRHGHHLRDVVGRPGRVDRGQQRRGGRHLRPRTAARGVRLGGRQAPAGEARVHGGRRGGGRAHQARAPDRPERGGHADRRHQARGPRHARLHVRHDRPVEGCALTHRQPDLGLPPGRRRAARGVGRGQLHAGLPPAGAHPGPRWCRWRA